MKLGQKKRKASWIPYVAILAVGVVGTGFLQKEIKKRFERSKQVFINKTLVPMKVYPVSNTAPILNGTNLETTFIGVDISHAVMPAPNRLGLEELPQLSRGHVFQQKDFDQIETTVKVSYADDGLVRVCKTVIGKPSGSLFTHKLHGCGEQSWPIEQTYKGQLDLGLFKLSMDNRVIGQRLSSEEATSYAFDARLSYDTTLDLYRKKRAEELAKNSFYEKLGKTLNVARSLKNQIDPESANSDDKAKPQVLLFSEDDYAPGIVLIKSPDFTLSVSYENAWGRTKVRSVHLEGRFTNGGNFVYDMSNQGEVLELEQASYKPEDYLNVISGKGADFRKRFESLNEPGNDGVLTRVFLPNDEGQLKLVEAFSSAKVSWLRRDGMLEFVESYVNRLAKDVDVQPLSKLKENALFLGSLEAMGLSKSVMDSYSGLAKSYKSDFIARPSEGNQRKLVLPIKETLKCR